jgi:regulator of RNase E activity RraB
MPQPNQKSMGILDFLKPKVNAGKFITEEEYQRNLHNQKEMAPQTMEQLRNLNVTEDKQLKLEFFFYTNTAEKAEQLSNSLSLSGYSVQHGKSAGDKKLFVITGWTSKMPMVNDTVVDWTSEMCELGYQFDCDFDGWGTNPEQD